jgi:glycolate oxidase FAD binding subunit
MNAHAAGLIGSKNDLKSSKYVVAVGFDDSLKTVQWQTQEIAKELPNGCELEIVRDSQALPLWHDLTESYANSGEKFTARVVTRPSQLSHILDSSDNDAWAIQAHAGQGIATFTSRHDLDLKTALNHVAQLTELVRKSGGSVSITHSPTAWKPEFQIWGESRPDWSIMDGIKSALDPNRILNPGRFLDLC